MSGTKQALPASDILKRLAISFGIALAVTIIYWTSLDANTGNEGKQFYFVALLLNMGICVISGFLSLFALLNTKVAIVSNKGYSLLSFVGPPFLLFLALLVLFSVNSRDSDTLSDFLEIAMPSIVHCLALVWQFLMFRHLYENNKR